jgi:poly-gamma-glutamate synthesis protein (capsule biosynthesis protein)
MSGDLLWHNTVWQSAEADAARTGAPGRYDFDPMFAALRPLVESADLALCHEEVPFAGPGEPLQSFPVFAAPPQVAPWVASMGWDACTTASNHAVDQGFEGLKHTADLLEANGVRHVGTFRTARERREPVILTTDEGVRIGVVAGTYSLNGFPLPEGRPWSVSMWDARNLLEQAKAARRAGADIVVVHLHGGDEYSHLPNTDQVELVRRLTASPAVDLVLGEHAHVVQPITRVNGKWVVYGMGNMVAQQDPAQPRTYEGITVRFEFSEGADGRFRVTEAAYVPTYWNNYLSGPIRIQRVVQALAAGRGDRARLLEARAEIREAVHALGGTQGLVER